MPEGLTFGRGYGFWTTMVEEEKKAACRRRWGTLDPFYEDGPVMGRSVANGQFLRFLLNANPFDEYHFFLPDKGSVARLDALLAKRHPALHAEGRLMVAERIRLPAALKAHEYAVFHLSDCISHPAGLARLRNACSRAVFPITGVTHSLSYVRYTRDFLAQLWPGCTPRDAIVATSRAGAEVVRRVFEGLRRQYGLSEAAFPGPGIEIVPLGVDTEAIRPAGGAGRAEARRVLGLAPDMVLPLVFGRLSPASKMDLLPLLRAFQRAFADGLDRTSVGLVVAGWDEEGSGLTETLGELARNIGLSLRLVPNPDDEAKLALYHACDFLVTVSDNLQETFGLTVLEAEAAGLPVLASDFDGYRDLVLPQESGLLVPTTGPGATGFIDDLAPLLYDSQYHLMLAQETAVDVPALARSLAGLCRDPGLRARMGRTGRELAERHFAWPTVIARYVRLWERLASMPVDEAGLRAAGHPLAMEYGRVFAAHPSRSLDGLRLRWSRTGEAVYRGREFPVLYAAVDTLVSPEAVHQLLFLARGGASAPDLAARLAAASAGLDAEAARYHILWCLKHDLLEEA